MYIVVDFDGTCVEHEYPKVGKDVPGAVNVLKRLIKNGHKLILFTMRSEAGVDKGLFGSGLNDAVDWFKKNDIELFGVNENPSQYKWTSSPKAYGEIYIDDAALGCPLAYPGNFKRPYVDWFEIEKLLEKRGVFKD